MIFPTVALGSAGEPTQSHAAASRISVCIVCRNEADKLGACLASVRWADEILVMDLESTDGSAALAAEAGARVVSRAPFPIVEPLRNELAALAASDWILALDPDEQVASGLPRELRALAERADLDALVIPRMNIDLGYAASTALHRYEPQLRMYRRSRVVWPTVPNALPKVADQRKQQLPFRDELVIMHDRNRNIPEALERSIRYAPAQAQSMIDQGQVFSAKGMAAAMVAQIDKEFFRGEAWKDGVPGVLRACLLVGYKFNVWAAFWQLSDAQRTPEDDRFVYRIGAALAMLRKGWLVGKKVARVGRRLVRL